MVDFCEKCHDHSNEELCLKCNTCQRQHMQKYGIKWVKERTKKISGKPCPHSCRFQLPNKKWITYKCTRYDGHADACDFGVNKKTIERIARDSIGGR